MSRQVLLLHPESCIHIVDALSEPEEDKGSVGSYVVADFENQAAGGAKHYRSRMVIKARFSLFKRG